MITIYPYKNGQQWIFDDPRVGLVHEPLVRGIPTIIERVAAIKHICHPEDGVAISFSARPFSGYDLCLDWLTAENGGNWYRSKQLSLSGWLCPALYKYYKHAPRRIYARLDAIPPAKAVTTSPVPAAAHQHG